MFVPIWLLTVLVIFAVIGVVLVLALLIGHILESREEDLIADFKRERWVVKDPYLPPGSQER